jgi:hypothetical protein
VLEHPLQPQARPPLWDGQAAKRIVEVLRRGQGTS